MNYISEVLSFLAGLVGGSLLTVAFTRNKASGRGRVTDQSGSRAGGDIVGGNKSSGNDR